MSKSLPRISNQIRSEEIREIIEKNFVTIMPVWIPLQLTWVNNVYRTFHDYEKFMIIMHLLMNTFETYSKNFVKLDYEEYFDQNEPFDFKIENKTAMEQANQALSYIYFVKNREKLQKFFPNLEIVHTSIFGNYLRFILSGGLNFRKILPDFLIGFIKIIEIFLSPLKKILGVHYMIVIKKTS